MIHLSKAQEVLNEVGDYETDVDAAQWDGYLGRTFAQLVWWALAARRQREDGSADQPAAFARDPWQHNAP